MEKQRNVSAFVARTHLGELMDYIRYSREPCFIERHGKRVAALVDIRTYERMALPERYRRWTDEAVAQIASHYKPEKIILFGSAARGEVQEGSDIDLFIVKETSSRPPERIEEVLRLLPPENPAEPHVYTPQEVSDRLTLNDPFVTGIVRKGFVVYDAQA